MTTWVKICGVTRIQDAHAAFDCGADAIGINFWPSSKRYCRPEHAREIVAALSPGALVFGVFVRATREEIEEVARDVGLGGVQLHGGEPASEAEGWDLPLIRAVAATSRLAVVSRLNKARETGDRYRFPNDGRGDTAETAREIGTCPRFPRGTYRVLVDNAAGGGSGTTIDPELLDGVDLRDAILAGGLTPVNVAANVARYRPFGVDTASGVEHSPGIKDASLIEAFVRQARAPKPPR